MKSSFLIRFTAVILTGGQIFAVSCAKQADTTAGSTSAESESESTTAEETEETARLELEARDFDGRTFTFLTDSWRLLKPAFYENVLMGKLARDDESKDTLEYIYGNLRWDVGNLLSIGNFPSTLAGMSANLNTDIASFLAQNLPVVEGDLVKFNESIAE